MRRSRDGGSELSLSLDFRDRLVESSLDHVRVHGHNAALVLATHLGQPEHLFDLDQLPKRNVVHPERRERGSCVPHVGRVAHHDGNLPVEVHEFGGALAPHATVHSRQPRRGVRSRRRPHGRA